MNEDLQLRYRVNAARSVVWSASRASVSNAAQVGHASAGECAGIGKQQREQGIGMAQQHCGPVIAASSIAVHFAQPPTAESAVQGIDAAYRPIDT